MSVSLSPPMFLQFFVPGTGQPAVGYQLFTYIANSSTKQATWTDSTQLTQSANPLIADANGVMIFWLDPTLLYKFVLAPKGDTDPPSSPIYSVDNISPNITGATLTAALIGSILYPRTTAEIAASVTPVNFVYAPGVVDRYQTNTTPGTTLMDTGFLRAAAQNAAGGPPIQMLAAVYLITGVSLRYNNAAIIGPGSAVCTLRQNPAAFGTGGVVEVGNTALDGPNYDVFTARGFTIDGNRSNIAIPVDDLHGHGMPLTFITHYNISDVRAINCWNAGVGIFINSNYGEVECYVENCGNSTFTAPGFDINSSKFIHAIVVSKGCQQGARNLDNSWGNILDVTVDSAIVAGFTDGNQTVNEGYDNNFTINVRNCGGDGVQIAANARNSIYRLNVDECGGNGVQEVYSATASQRPGSNIYIVTTKKNGLSSCLIGGDGSDWNISSYLDGRTGAAGSSYAVVGNGQRNTIKANITDSGTPQVRGVQFSATSVSNNLLAFTRNTLVSNFQDLGTTNWNTEVNSYTPTWTSSGTQPALNNGTITGSYVRNNRMITVNILLTMGSTTTFGTGVYFFSLPTQLANTEALGSAVVEHTGVSDYACVAKADNTNGIRLFTGAQPATTVQNNVPFTFVSTDTIAITLTYESAT